MDQSTHLGYVGNSWGMCAGLRFADRERMNGIIPVMVRPWEGGKVFSGLQHY